MSWRFAARLARREVRRRPGRTILVTLLVAIPVFGMTVGAIAVRTDSDSVAERYYRLYGAADLVIDSDSFGSRAEGPSESVVERSVTSRRIDGRIHPSDLEVASTWATVNEDPLDDALLAGRYQLIDGRVPRDGEVAISTELAERLEVGVGDHLVLRVPDLSAEVVGLVRAGYAFDAHVMVAPGFPFERAEPESILTTTWYDLEAGIDPWEEAAKIASGGAEAHAASFDFDAFLYGGEVGDNTAELAWGFVAGVIALAIVGIIICAAFATSARRQLVTLGQLSANGAETRLLRRMLALQGTVSGILGAVVGVGGALGALSVLRDLYERAIGHDPGPYVTRASDLIVIALTGAIAATVAAAIPARSVVRVPVLAALGGRRPLGRLPRRLVPLGLGLSGAGVALLVLVALAGREGAGEGNTPHALAAAAVVGGLLILAGVCCSSPVAVSLLTPLAARGGGTIRLAARSLARLRARSAAVVTAIAAAGIVATSAGTAIAMNPPRGNGDGQPRNEVIVSAYANCRYEVQACDDGTGTFDPPPLRGYVTPEHLDRVAAIVPGIELRPIRAGSFDPRPAGPNGYFTQTRVLLEVVTLDPPLIAEDWYLDRLNVSARDRETLEREGVLGSFEETVIVSFPAQDGDVKIEAPAAQGRSNQWPSVLIMTPEFARSRGFQSFDWRYLGIAPSDLSANQRDRLRALCCEYDESWRWDTTIPLPVPTNEVEIALEFRYESWQPSRALLDAIVVAVALLLVGLVIAIGLSLSAVESRDERDTLSVLGARPRSLRRLAAIKAAVLVVAGGLLAIPAGFVPTWLVFALSNRFDDAGQTETIFDQLAFPWTTALGLVVALPILVGLAAWTASAIAHRFRPVRVSTMAFD